MCEGSWTRSSTLLSRMNWKGRGDKWRIYSTNKLNKSVDRSKSKNLNSNAKYSKSKTKSKLTTCRLRKGKKREYRQWWTTTVASQTLVPGSTQTKVMEVECIRVGPCCRKITTTTIITTIREKQLKSSRWWGLNRELSKGINSMEIFLLCLWCRTASKKKNHSIRIKLKQMTACIVETDSIRLSIEALQGIYLYWNSLRISRKNRRKRVKEIQPKEMRNKKTIDPKKNRDGKLLPMNNFYTVGRIRNLNKSSET